MKQLKRGLQIVASVMGGILSVGMLAAVIFYGGIVFAALGFLAGAAAIVTVVSLGIYEAFTIGDSNK
tara:strand:- start:179 stop:379 length:201 start_codon:yes stop_codon:yes gene_type:complete